MKAKDKKELEKEIAAITEIAGELKASLARMDSELMKLEELRLRQKELDAKLLAIKNKPSNTEL